MNERELDLELGDALDEVRRLRRLVGQLTEDKLRLQHRLEHIYAISHLALHPSPRNGAYEAPEADEGSTTD